MTTTVRRREPVQERSRQLVERILDTAAELIDEDGVDAVSTRSVADRAGVAYPSLYRFFADRDDILDRLLERHLIDSDALAEQAERDWQVTSIAEVVDAELDLQLAYYRDRPSAARLWMGGRTSAAVVAKVHARMQRLAERLYTRGVEEGFIAADTNPVALVVLVELGDRILELAYRRDENFDPDVLVEGRRVLKLCADGLAPPRGR